MTSKPGPRSPIVFLLDVDNTLLDNDRVVEDLKELLHREVGAEWQARYWEIFEQHRRELGYADYLGTLQRYRMEDRRDPNLIAIARFLLNYPFRERMYPGAFEVLTHLEKWGPTALLTDGDVVFQPLKIDRSGLFQALSGRVLLYVHKEEELPDIERRFPADHYVVVDDKIRLLTAMKLQWGDRMTSVFPRQGHYAHAPDVSDYPPPDITVEHIADLLQFDPPPGVPKARHP
ncbi:MAG: HAD family hydrolase [Gemmatimonadota bacterium]